MSKRANQKQTEDILKMMIAGNHHHKQEASWSNWRQINNFEQLEKSTRTVKKNK